MSVCVRVTLFSNYGLYFLLKKYSCSFFLSPPPSLSHTHKHTHTHTRTHTYTHTHTHFIIFCPQYQIFKQWTAFTKYKSSFLSIHYSEKMTKNILRKKHFQDMNFLTLLCIWFNLNFIFKLNIHKFRFF